MPRSTQDRFGRALLAQLLRLRAGNALPLAETKPGRGIWRWGLRVGGQRVEIDLDATVREMRCYHDRDEIAMSPLSPETMDVLLGRRPVPAGIEKGDESEIAGEIRKIVAEWRDGNARLYMRPPAKAGHPDNWNHA